MFGWLKAKGMSVVQNQCKINIKLNVKTLILITDAAEKTMMKNEGVYSDLDKKEIMDTAKSLYEDIVLGIKNGLEVGYIENDIVGLIVRKEDANNLAVGMLGDMFKNIRRQLAMG